MSEKSCNFAFKKEDNMDTMECTTNPTTSTTIYTPPSTRPKLDETDQTPESELLTVEEYFGILRKRVNDYYDNLQVQKQTLLLLTVSDHQK